MPVVTCHNVRLDENGQPKPCGQFLAELTDLQIDILRTDPDKHCTLRCRMCPPDQRWIRLSWDGNRLVFSSSDQKPNFNKQLRFDETDIFEQVG